MAAAPEPVEAELRRFMKVVLKEKVPPTQVSKLAQRARAKLPRCRQSAVHALSEQLAAEVFAARKFTGRIPTFPFRKKKGLLFMFRTSDAILHDIRVPHSAL